MHGIEMQGGWRGQSPNGREYAASALDTPEKLLDFFDILTRDRERYLPRYMNDERVILQSHVTSSSGPADFDSIMQHAIHIPVRPDDIMNFAFLRLALDQNPALAGIETLQEDWWGLRTMPYEFLRPLVSTIRFATPFMLHRMFSQGIAPDYIRAVPFFEETDYLSLYEAGVDPSYTRQLMVFRSTATPEDSGYANPKLLVPAKDIMSGWRDGIPVEYLKETVV